MMGWNDPVPNKSQGIVNENRRNLATLWKMAHTRVSECFCVSCRHQSQKGSFVRFQILISLFLFFKATYIFSSDQITVILWCFGFLQEKSTRSDDSTRIVIWPHCNAGVWFYIDLNEVIWGHLIHLAFWVFCIGGCLLSDGSRF